MAHHAYVLAGGLEESAAAARAHARAELGLEEGSADLITLSYALLTVEDARKIIEIAAQAPIMGDAKVLIISASRVYHEAQNALLKLFEEPSAGTTLYLVVPALGQLLPTLRSRVEVLQGDAKTTIGESAEEFLKMNAEKRSVFIKRLASGEDESERRAARDEALAIVNGIEALAYVKWRTKADQDLTALLTELARLRGYLHERSAPLRMILEHISLVLPKALK